MENIILKTCETVEEFDKAKQLRLEVFCREQTFAEEAELDEYDSPFPRSNVLHIIATDLQENVLGTVRMLKFEDYAKLSRLAVSKSARGKHIGERLVTQGESSVAGTWGSKTVLISSQHQVEAFYLKCGYKRTEREQYLDEGWPRKSMKETMHGSADQVDVDVIKEL